MYTCAAMAAIGEKEWFFYVPRDRKYRNGDRPNRVTASGYWKATGADRMIRAESSRPIGLKKTLVFYSGKAPKGVRSSWIMNEYRLPTADTHRYHKTEISLCRVYKRTGIDDGHSSSRSTPSSRAAAATARHDNNNNKQAAAGNSSSTSTPTPPPTPSKLHLLQQGSPECTSPPPATIATDHQARGHRTKPCGALSGYLQQSAAGDQQQQDQGAALLHYQPQQYSGGKNNTNNGAAFASTTTYSLLSLVNAASMGAGGASAAAIDELNTLVGGAQPAASYHIPGTGSLLHHDHFVVPLPTPTTAPLGTLPMSLAAISDKMIWDWNPIPDAAGTRDYGGAGFK
ncbi:NAC domain-containing protein 35 isoform X2 [Brachypodium distachyon]|uniref:NAC domain-containing protein n=1 Tax=Brachypodium distachyon TaxID=15368 RepID=A0A0Q3JEM7_BRADI|nr:NAC domain-containing protein 35 isoform X2 [Brachypodium distachyon]KQK10908.2 hypothetical protein BRADI_2g57297v3 [Brachypodium distachyon]|eukprot:XP_024315980.1 NAC domain-containing protein 35 isoform X2 [Brachypodium distachyon]